MLPRELNLKCAFPEINYEQWKAGTEADLKGVPFDKKMIASLYDGVELLPLYTVGDWPSETDPSCFPHSPGAHSL